MVPSLRSAPLALLYYIAVLAQVVSSAVIEHDFNVTWVWANPDGAFARPVIGINGQFPLPQINATVGDTVVVNLYNALGNQSTSLHFHGMFMNGTSHMDGTTFVSQCAVSPGSTFRYQFETLQSGTYWYHSHAKAQYPDGLRGLLIVSDPESPIRSKYDEEISMTISDWYHGQMADLLVSYDNYGGHMPRDPGPDSSLINDSHDIKISIQPGKTYLVRLTNMGAFVSQWFWIEGHSMRIVEVDGVLTEEAETNMLYISTGQRYSFLLTTKSDSTANYAMVSRVDSTAYAMMGGGQTIEAHGWLVYDDKLALPMPSSSTSLSTFDDTTLVPLDQEPLFENVDQSISLIIGTETANGVAHWKFNTAHYQPPDTPTIFTALTSGDSATEAQVYGSRTMPLILEHNKVVEITVRNGHMMDHPIHLHGHNFQVVKRTDKTYPAIPMRRDTIIVKGSETLKFRFRADNPGVWVIHCHMEWHAHSGLMATIVEAPTELQQQPIALKLQSAEGIHQACPGGQVSDNGQSTGGTTTGTTEGAKEGSGTTTGATTGTTTGAATGASTGKSSSAYLKTETIVIGLGGAACLAVAAYFAWKVYQARRLKDQAYLLVPLEETDPLAREESRIGVAKAHMQGP